MENTTFEVLVSRLLDWGVNTVFAPVGDRIDDRIDRPRRRGGPMRLVQTRHAEAAALMATGYAKTTGRLGVCVATSVPSGLGLAAGLYDAKLDHAPVLAVTGGPATAVRGTGGPRDVDLTRLYQDVAGLNQAVVDPRQLPALLDLAVRHARAGPDVAHLCLPEDVARTPVSPDRGQVGGSRGADRGREPATAPPTGLAGMSSAPVTPCGADVARAADILAVSRRPAILVGAGARGAGELVETLADTIAAPVVASLPGRAVVPDDSPFAAGTIGPMGSGPGRELMDDIDTLIMLGTDPSYPDHLPAPGTVRVIQVDRQAVRAGARMPVELSLVADVRQTLHALLPLLARHANRAHLARYQRMSRDRRAGTSAEAGPDDDEAIRSGQLVRALDDLAADDAVLCGDPAPVAGWAARYWTIRGRRDCQVSAGLGVDGSALPYAIAVQHAWPGRQVLALLGADGFSRMMAELATARRHDLPVKVMIANDGGPDLAAWAGACGVRGVRVEHRSDLRAAVADALACHGPALVDVAVHVDPAADTDTAAADTDTSADAADAGTGRPDRPAVDPAGATPAEWAVGDLAEVDVMTPHLALRFVDRPTAALGTD